MDLGDSESYLLSFCVNTLSHTMKSIVNDNQPSDKYTLNN